MRLHDLPVKGRRRKKRLGRGNASTRGTYSGRGVKGQRARAGSRIRPGFEGGQTPIFMRLPKRRGGTKTSERPSPVNVGLLEDLFAAGSRVDLHTLKKAGIVGRASRAAKILGTGELTKSLVVAIPVSASAKEKIEKAGGRVEIREMR